MSYKAKVCHISTRPHPNADRVQLGVASGYQVVVGLETESGQLGVYFPCDGQLSHEMCMANNLYRKDPKTGEPMGGYFEENRRVRAQPFRGQKSEGFWVPLTYLRWTGVDLSTLEAGDEFDALNGKEVCRKYVSEATKRAMERAQKQGQKKKKKEIPMFKKHFDTPKLRYTASAIPEGAVLHITEKLHGTSGRTGYVQVEDDLPAIKRAINNFFRKEIFRPKREWRKVSGSRRVTYDPDQSVDQGFYSGMEFRFEIHERLRLKKGETLYYEIVGFTDKKTPIMASHKITDKALKKKYGDEMVYRYGTDRDQAVPYDIYVYRITQTNEDGDSVDLSWPQVMRRCNELGLRHVPHYDTLVYDGDEDSFLELVEQYSQGSSKLDSTHIREGVCITVDHHLMGGTHKYKGFWFCELEGIAKNSDEYVDLEDIS